MRVKVRPGLNLKLLPRICATLQGSSDDHGQDGQQVVETELNKMEKMPFLTLRWKDSPLINLHGGGHVYDK